MKTTDISSTYTSSTSSAFSVCQWHPLQASAHRIGEDAGNQGYTEDNATANSGCGKITSSGSGYSGRSSSGNNSNDSSLSYNKLSSYSSSSNKQLPRSRQRHGACCVGDYVYVFCGKDGTSPLKDIWRYHVGQKRWEPAEVGRCSFPFLQGHTTVAYKRQILIFGGTFSDCLGDIQLWTYSTDLGHLREVWIEPGSAQPMCRRDHSAVVHNNLMYVYGGFMDSLGASKELWAFNIDEEEWTEVTSLSNSKPSQRYGHSAVVANNSMWMFGGLSGLSPCADLWKYNFGLHQWTKVKTLGNPPCLSGHTACVIQQQMVVVGGNTKGKPVNDVWAFAFDTITWQKLSNTGMALPSLAFHTCVVFPSQSRCSQVTDRACSTPYLQPSARQQELHLDRFMVRPRTSPSVLEERAGSQSSDTAGRDSSGSTQVMTLECIMSGSLSDQLDCRIHVNLREPLVSSSPDGPCFYNSGLSVGSSCAEDGSFLQEERSHCSDDVLLFDTFEKGSQVGHEVCADTNRDSVDLINLSDSPVLKACLQGNSVRRGSQQLFWNDLFVEDLETVDVEDLDDLKISYPSKNSLLPAPPQASKKSRGQRLIENSATNTGMKSASKEHHYQKSSHHQHLSNYRKTKQGTEMQPILRQSNRTSGARSLPVKPAESCSSKSGTQQNLQTEIMCLHSSHHSSDMPRHACLATDSFQQQSETANRNQPQRTQVGSFPRTWKQASSFSSGGESSNVGEEAETSFSRTQDKALRIFAGGENVTSGEKAGTTFSATQEQALKSLAGRECNISGEKTEMIFSASREEGLKTLTNEGSLNSDEKAETSFSGRQEQTLIIPAGRESRGGRLSVRSILNSHNLLAVPEAGELSVRDRSREAADTSAGEAAEQETFLLVFGGRIEERGSIHPKPIAMWKGVIS